MANKIGMTLSNLSSLSLVVVTDTLALAAPFPPSTLTIPPRVAWKSDAAALMSTTERN
jgi:hypothetical protein